MNTPEKLNAITRMAFYISLVLVFYHKKIEYFLIFVATLLITWILYNNANFENLENEKEITTCTGPTLDNPFMNLSFVDNMDNPGKPPACDVTDPEIKIQMDNGFYNNLFRDTSDIFNKFNSQRQFYTMPATTIPNDRESFMKWCYSTPPSYKENQEAVLLYEDPRNQRQIFPNEFQNPIFN